MRNVLTSAFALIWTSNYTVKCNNSFTEKLLNLRLCNMSWKKFHGFLRILQHLIYGHHIIVAKRVCKEFWVRNYLIDDFTTGWIHKFLTRNQKWFQRSHGCCCWNGINNKRISWICCVTKVGYSYPETPLRVDSVKTYAKYSTWKRSNYVPYIFFLTPRIRGSQVHSILSENVPKNSNFRYLLFHISYIHIHNCLFY